VNKSLQVYIMAKCLCKNLDYFSCTEYRKI